MRIISNFHDYYDCAQSTGQDRTLIYQRYSKEVSPKGTSLPLHPLSYYNHQYYEESYTLGFCGKIIPFFVLSINEKQWICYSLEQIDKFITNNFKQCYVDYYRGKTKWHRRANWGFWQTRKKYQETFDKIDKLSDTTRMKTFEEHRCPIFLLHQTDRGKHLLTLNPSLKEFDFYRQLDPFQTYQEIAMFLGSMAEPRKPIPKISDETMAEIKGFDKFSFRKPKKS